MQTKTQTTVYGSFLGKITMVIKNKIIEKIRSPHQDGAWNRVCWGADKKKLYLIEIQ